MEPKENENKNKGSNLQHATQTTAITTQISDLTQSQLNSDSQRGYQDRNDGLSAQDEEALIAGRKQSQLQNHLEKIRKLETFAQIYRKMAEESAELEEYERDTNLGKPTELETDQVLIEETKDDVSMDANLIEKMKEEAKKGRYNPENDKAFLVEEHDLLLQYVAGTEALQVYREKMDIKTDIKRLTQLYLEANTKFKLSMPS